MCKTLLRVSACILLLAAPSGAAQQPPAPLTGTQLAPLLPGEALALAGPDGKIYRFGDSPRELPMGSLARLVWLRLEGSEWGAMNVVFNCTGSFQGDKCWLPKGHGKLDLAKALQGDCELAFLLWGQVSVQWWIKDYGEGGARARLEETFGPFLGKRLPPGEGLPRIDASWVGAGDLLRTTPEDMLVWLMDPAQDETLRMARRHLLSFGDYNYKDNVWWVLPAAADDPSAAGAQSAWAVGSNGQITAVLHLPVGKTRAEAMARFRAVLMVPPRK